MEPSRFKECIGVIGESLDTFEGFVLLVLIILWMCGVFKP